MLVLTRKPEESLIIAGDIRITILGLRGNQVRLGIEAPDRVGIYREEVTSLLDSIAGHCRGRGEAPGSVGIPGGSGRAGPERSGETKCIRSS